MSRLLLLLALLALSGPGYSAEPFVDAGIKAQLDALELTYTVDADGDFQVTFEVENDRTQLVIMGGWTLQKEMAMFVLKIPTSAISDQLRDAMEAAALAADQIEAELTPGKDEF